MKHIDRAQQEARDGAELGDLVRRYNDAYRSTLTKRASEQAQDLLDTMQAAKFTGNREAFYAAQAELKLLVEAL